MCSSLCTRFYGLFYVKNKVSAKTSLIFIFYCGTVSSETGEKMSELFSDFLASKNETGWWFHVWNWHKIMKPSRIRSGKKNETDGTRLRRGRQFHFFSWPNLDGFIILVSFTHETTASFIFWAKKQKKFRHFSPVSLETGHKKKVRFPAKTLKWLFI